jgi:hypothetical protein
MFRIRALNIKVGACVPLALQGHSRHFIFKSSKPVTDEEIVNAANWKDTSPFKRLGMKPWNFSQDNLKRHHKVLARHFHPDAGNDASGQAFIAIQEAYEQLSIRKDASSGNGESDDTQERRAKARFMGSSVNLFLLGTVVFIIFIARHNRERLGKSYIEYCIVMFLALQIFPRLLAAAIIFSYLSSLLIERDEALSRSKALLVVEKMSSKSLKLRVDGFTDDEWLRTSIEVVIHEGNSDGVATSSQYSHLKFDKGVREIVLPYPGNRKKSSGGLDVFAVRDDIKMLVASKYCPL